MPSKPANQNRNSLAKLKHIDYRFSLANERTFLAWIRTALAFLAGAVIIDQFIAVHQFPILELIIALLLAVGSGLFAIGALVRWRRNEKAMQQDQALPYNHLLSLCAILISIVALCFIIVFFASKW